MFAIVLSFIGIALLAAVLYGGMNYMNLDSYDNKFEENNVVSGFFNYETAITSYKKVFNVYPDSLSWENDLTKINVLLPNNQKYTYDYEYNVTDNTVALCYFGSIKDEKEYEVIEILHNKGDLILGNGCFKKNNETIDKTTYPVSIGLTKWIKN